MRLCPTCYVTYPDTYRICTLDHTPLVEAPADPAPDAAGRPERRTWTAQAALARGELRVTDVEAAAARAEAARQAAAAQAAAERAALAQRWRPWAWGLAVVLLVGLVSAGAWRLRAPSAPMAQETSGRVRPTQSEGGRPSRADPAAIADASAAGWRADAPGEPAAEPAGESAVDPAPEREEQPLVLPARTDAPSPEKPPAPVAPAAPAAPAQASARHPEPRPAARPETRAVARPAPARTAAQAAAVARSEGRVATVAPVGDEQVVAVQTPAGARRLAKTFIAATTFGTFRFERLDGRDLLVFSASDARWTTHYAWDYEAGTLYWRAFDTRTRTAERSESVVPGSAVDARLRQPG